MALETEAKFFLRTGEPKRKVKFLDPGTNMQKVKLRVHNTARRIRPVSVGDTVFIVRSLPKVPLDSISPFPAPFIVQIDEGTVKRGQAFRFKVQFQTRDKTTHVGYFFARHLRATKKVLGIGAKVVVRGDFPCVMVPPGTEGTVVGGDGNTYHVTFFLDNFEPPITVSQDGVPADALTPPGVKGKEVELDEEEEEEGGEHGDAAGGEDDTIGEEVAHAEEEEAEVGEDDARPADADDIVEQEAVVISPTLRAALQTHLQGEQVDLLCKYLRHRGVTQIADALTLQGHLAQFLRSSKEDEAELPPDHVVALKQVGASDDELTKLARDGVTAKLNVGAAVKKYVKSKL